MKVALVYDWLVKFGGIERVLLNLHQLWPEAPLFTSVHNPQAAPWAKVFQVKPSWLQSWPGARSRHELYAGLMPLAFESLDFSDYDLVISISSSFAKGILTNPRTLHLNYCLTPIRWLWSHADQYQGQPGLGQWSSLSRWGLKCLKLRLKAWDLIASQRPDAYFAISKTVQSRIKKYYNRDSEVIYPGIDTAKFSSKPKPKYNIQYTKYYLIVSRLVGYKNIYLAIQACQQLKLNLKIIGQGRDQGRLKRLAGPGVEFLGQVSDKNLIAYYQNCQALLIPAEEDFGLVSLEAQAAGKPVIALIQGGVKETLIDNQTGILFNQPKVASLKQALTKFAKMKFSAAACQQQAKRFDQAIFKTKFKQKVEGLWQQHQQQF